MANIRILALDGGGTRAGLLARALGEIYGERTRGREILRRFAFAAGNSGGSIVLAALCCDCTPREIVDLYADPKEVRRLFSPTWVASVPCIGELLPHYSSRGKFAALKEVLDRYRRAGEPAPSTIRITDWPGHIGADVRLLVTAFDYDRERAAFFRSDVTSFTRSSSPSTDPTLAEAVHASTNAPISYFDRPAAFNGRRYWDGAMAGYNNPVLAAVIEALAAHPDRVEDFRVLSIGTGTSVRPLTTDGARPPLGRKPRGERLCEALALAATVILDDPPDAALFHAYMAMRQPLPARGARAAGHLVRISPMVRPEWDGERWMLPAGVTQDQFAAMADMRLDPMKRRELECVRLMGELWIEGKLANQPIRFGERFRCDIGHDRFAEAADHWLAIA